MAKATPAGAPSTDGRATVPCALPLKDAGDAILPSLARQLGAAAPTVEACRAVLADPARTRARFLAMPAYCAVAAEVLTDLGGEAEGGTIANEVARRTCMPPAEVAKLLSTVGIAPGNVLLVDRSSGSMKSRSFALIADGAASVARVVRGVTLPQNAPRQDAEGQPWRDARERIALATLAVHKSLRLTVGGTVNRASLKPFVKGVGVEPDRAEALLARALRDGLLARAGGDAVATFSLPTLDALATAGSVVHARVDLAKLVPDDRWVSLEAASRALAAAELAAGDSYGGPRTMYLARLYNPASASQALASAAALEHLEHGGATWVRRRCPQPGNRGTGDGHVTPSFDVLLGPRADLAVVAQVGLGAALTRVDQLLTFHIGPRTVEAGLAAGMDPAAFVAALERVGRHGLPDNVRAMIEDWIKSARFARAEQVVLLRVAERMRPKLVEALGEHCLGTVGASQLVVGPRSAGETIAAKLAAFGLPGTLPEAWLESEDGPYHYEPGPLRPFEPLLPPYPDADPSLVARYQAARARGFADDLALLTQQRPPPAATPPAAPRAVPAAPPPRPAQPAPSDGARAEAAALATTLFDACRAEITAWMEQLDPLDRKEAEMALEFPMAWAPLAALLPDYRARALKRSRSFPDLNDEAWRLYGGSRRSQRGIELMSALARADVSRDIFDEVLDSLGGLVDHPKAPRGARALFAARPSPATSAKPAQTLPANAPIARQPEAVRKWMLRAAQQSRPVRIEVGSRTSTVRVSGVRTQGRDTFFLVIDAETDEGRAIPLASIASVMFADGQSPRDG
jgi:hypothetical protein